MQKIRVGDPMDKNTDVGAINSKEQLTKIVELSASGDSEGAERMEPFMHIAIKGILVCTNYFYWCHSSTSNCA
jgi:aldehyde dehydrogenase (NAD+)